VQDSHLTVSNRGVAHAVAAAVAAVVVALPEEMTPAGAPEGLPPAAEWLLQHMPHSMTAAETRHQAGHQQGPGGWGGGEVWYGAVQGGGARWRANKSQAGCVGCLGRSTNTSGADGTGADG